MHKTLYILSLFLLMAVSGFSQDAATATFKLVTDQSEIQDGKRYIIVMKDLKLAAQNKTTNYAFDVEPVTIQDNKITVDPAKYAFTFEKVDGGFKIKIRNSNTSYRWVYLHTVPEKIISFKYNEQEGDAAFFKISLKDDNTVQFLNNGNRSILYNNTKMCFMNYAEPNDYLYPSLYVEVENTPVSLSDLSTTAPAAATNTTFTVNRTVVGKSWNAMALPFDMNETQLKAAFGDGVKVAELKEANSETIQFSSRSQNQLKAGEPVLIYNPGETKTSFTVENASITGVEAQTKTVGDYNFVATLKVSTLDAGDYFFSTKKANTVLKQNRNGQIKAFRAYLHASSPKAAKVSAFAVDGKATRIEGIKMSDTTTTVRNYNLAGQQVDRNYHGLVIRNGKKFIQK